MSGENESGETENSSPEDEANPAPTREVLTPEVQRWVDSDEADAPRTLIVSTKREGGDAALLEALEKAGVEILSSGRSVLIANMGGKAAAEAAALPEVIEISAPRPMQTKGGKDRSGEAAGMELPELDLLESAPRGRTSYGKKLP